MDVYLGLPSNFRSLLLAGFVGNSASQIFVVFLPLLAYQLGADPLTVGLVGGASNSVYAFMPFVVGRYSDRFGGTRRVFIVSSLLLLVVISLLYALASNSVELIILRIAEGVAWSAFWPTLEAAISEDPSRDASKSFSIFNGVSSAGFAIGPLVGTFLIVVFVHIEPVFLFTAALLACVVVLNSWGSVVRAEGSSEMGGRRDGLSRGNMDSSGQHGRTTGRTSTTIAVNAPSRPDGTTWKTLGFFMTVVALSVAVRGVLFTFLPPLVQSLRMPVLLIGVIGLVYGGVRILVFAITTRDDIRLTLFLNRANAQKLAIVALVLTCVSGTLPIVPDRSGLTDVVAFVILGISQSVIFLTAQMWMIVAADSRLMGRNSGLFESAVGVGGTFGPIAAGFISAGSLVVPFYLPALCLVFVPFIYAVFRERMASEKGSSIS